MTVRGKPSRTKPTRHSGLCTASPMSPTTISSDTKAPESIAFLAWKLKPGSAGSTTRIDVCQGVIYSRERPTSSPRGVCAATAALSISPVAKWHKQCSSFSFGDCVPLPQPGGPAKQGIRLLSITITLLVSADKSGMQDQYHPQLTYEHDMLFWLCCTFNTSLYLPDQCISGHILQVGCHGPD